MEDMVQPRQHKLPSLPVLLLVLVFIVAALFFIWRASNNEKNSLNPQDTRKVPAFSSMPAEWGFFRIRIDGVLPDDLHEVRWSRITGLIWSKLQNENGDYNWELLDPIVKDAQDRNLNLVFVLKTGNNKRFSEPSCYRASEESDKDEKYLHSCPLKSEYLKPWKDLVYSIIERYDGDGKTDMPGLKSMFTLDIQIENEAGSSVYWYLNEKRDGKKIADEYLKILRLAYEAKQEANPNTKIILPGIIHATMIARCTTGFLIGHEMCDGDFQVRNRVFTQEILKHPDIFDAIDIHEFIYFKFDPYFVEESLVWLHEEMKSNGYEKPIYSLEWTGSLMLRIRETYWGYAKDFISYFPYSGEFETVEGALDTYKLLDAPKNKKYRIWFEAEQAREFPKLFTVMLANGVTRLIHVQFTDFIREIPGWDNPWWNWQGITRYTGTVENPILIKKPSYYTYNMLVDHITGYTSVKELDYGTNTFVYEFIFDDKDSVYIAWAEEVQKNIDLSSYVSSSEVSMSHIVTALDNNNAPIIIPDEIVPASTIPVSDIPMFIVPDGY